MNSFLAIFTCAENSKNHEAWKKLDAQTQIDRMKKGTLLLEKWKEKYKNQIIYDGGPLGEMTKKVDNEGIHDIPSKVGAFVVVEANSHDEAAKIFLAHPHFAIFPGDAIEITERASRFPAHVFAKKSILKLKETLRVFICVIANSVKKIPARRTLLIYFPPRPN